MLPETDPGIGGGEGGGASYPSGHRSGEEEAAAGPSGAGREAGGEGDAGREETSQDRRDGAARPDDPGAGGAPEGNRHPSPHKPRVPKADLIRALKECNGNFAQTALVLCMDASSVRERVKNDPQLNAIWGKRSVTADEPEPPAEAATLLRHPDQLVAPVPAADLGKMVEATERILLEGGLEKLGVDKATIAKLQKLKSLNVDAGAMLARSLQDTHQLYYLRLLNLDARIDEIYETYLNPESPKYDKDIDPMTRMFWQRAYNECVEQMGKGHDRMMAGTQAMVAMMKADKDKTKPGEKPVEAAWETQVPKSVQRKAAKK